MAKDQISPDHVFIVRLWKEPKRNGKVTVSWRGRVTELDTGSERHFVGFKSLMGVLRKSLGIEKEKAKSEAKS